MTPTMLPYVTIDSAAPYVSGNSARPKNGTLFKRFQNKGLSPRSIAAATVLAPPQQPKRDRPDVALPKRKLKFISFPIAQSNKDGLNHLDQNGPKQPEQNVPPPSSSVEKSQDRVLPSPPPNNAPKVQAPNPQAMPSYTSSTGCLLTCLKYPGVSGTGWAAVHTDGFENDRHLIAALNRLRQEQYGWRSYFLGVKEIHYAEFRINEDRVTDMRHPALPPDDHREYIYEPRPPPVVPPITPRVLTYFFNNVADLGRYRSFGSGSETWILKSFPRLTDPTKIETFQAFQAKRERAWGIIMVEAYSFGRILTAVMSFVFAIAVITAKYFIAMMTSPDRWYSLLKYCTLFGLLLVLFIWIGGVIISSYDHPHDVCVVHSESQPQAVPASTKLNPWLRLIARSVRKAYSIWHQCLSVLIPWLNKTNSEHSYTATDFHDHHTDPHGSPIHQTSSGPGGSRERASDGQGQGHSEEAYVGRAFIPGLSFDLARRSSSDRDGNDEDGIELRDQNTDNSRTFEPDIEAAELFLHIVIPAGLSTKKQIPVRVTDLATDYDLSCRLNRIYRQHHPFWRPIFMVSSVRPTKYELYNKTHVYTKDTDDAAQSMPDIFNPPLEYAFSYWPRTPRPTPPLLRPEQLTSLFYDPDSAKHHGTGGIMYERQCYERSPKRKGVLTFMPNNGYPPGFGFEIVEKLNLRFILACELFIAFLAILLTFLYLGLAHGEQRFGAAATIGGYIFAIGQFVFAVIIAIIEKWELWAY